MHISGAQDHTVLILIYSGLNSGLGNFPTYHFDCLYKVVIFILKGVIRGQKNPDHLGSPYHIPNILRDLVFQCTLKAYNSQHPPLYPYTTSFSAIPTHLSSFVVPSPKAAVQTPDCKGLSLVLGSITKPASCLALPFMLEHQQSYDHTGLVLLLFSSSWWSQDW